MRTAATTVLFFSIGASVTNPMWLGLAVVALVVCLL